MSNNNGKTVLALLAGAAIGASIGILFAPDKGSKTREKIKDDFDDKKNEIKDKYEDLSEKLKMKFAMTKEQLESSFKDLVANVGDKTDDVIVTLEAKLEELRKTAATIKK